jgi:hypothetical protein
VKKIDDSIRQEMKEWGKEVKKKRKRKKSPL